MAKNLEKTLSKAQKNPRQKLVLVRHPKRHFAELSTDPHLTLKPCQKLKRSPVNQKNPGQKLVKNFKIKKNSEFSLEIFQKSWKELSGILV